MLIGCLFKTVRKYKVLFVPSLLGLFLAAFFLFRRQSSSPQIRLGRCHFSVTLADTPQKQQQGLSGHPGLTDDEGMLFVYSYPRELTFWMKDMNFPLDIIWLNNNEVVHLVPNLPAPQNGQSPQIVSSSHPADLVLEINAGLSAKCQIQAGSQLKKLNF